MNLRRSDIFDILGTTAQSIAHSTKSYSGSISTELLVSHGQMVYMHIPASELRNFVDSLLPTLAVNPLADSVRGLGHRYKAGHDLLLDVPRTFFNQGPNEALKHLGHIIATDFPTRAGIPIPGFSQSGLGSLLESCGIPKAWMSFNISDTGFGFLAIADSHSTLAAAIEGQLSMDLGTALDTFGAGGLELLVAVVGTTNPVPMTIAGIQNIMAGLVATWNTYSIYINPLDLFGTAVMSTLVGFGASRILLRESPLKATGDAIRSGIIGTFFSISSAFGYGALAGFFVWRLAQELAIRQNTENQNRLSVDERSYQILFESLLSGDMERKAVHSATNFRLNQPNHRSLPTSPRIIPSSTYSLPIRARTLNSSIALPDQFFQTSKSIALPNEPEIISDIYRLALSSLACVERNTSGTMLARE